MKQVMNHVDKVKLDMKLTSRLKFETALKWSFWNMF